MNSRHIALHKSISRFLAAATVMGGTTLSLGHVQSIYQLRDGLVQAACSGLAGSAFHAAKLPSIQTKSRS